MPSRYSFSVYFRRVISRIGRVIAGFVKKLLNEDRARLSLRSLMKTIEAVSAYEEALRRVIKRN